MTDLEQVLKNEKIQNVRVRSPLCVSREKTLKEVFEEMKKHKRGYVIVTDQNKPSEIAGIFTERDALTKVIEQKIPLSAPVERVMTPSPKVLKKQDSVAMAIEIMNQGHYRHIPLVNESNEVTGILGVRDLIQYLAEHYPYEVYNLPPNPGQVLRSPEGA